MKPFFYGSVFKRVKRNESGPAARTQNSGNRFYKRFNLFDLSVHGNTQGLKDASGIAIATWLASFGQN